MATPVILTTVRPGYIERHGVGAEALDKEMDKLVVRSNATVLQGAQFFRTAMAKAGSYKESDVGTSLELPPENEDSDNLPFATPIQGYSKSITIVNRRLAIQVERSFTEDELFSVARKLMGGLVRSGRLSIEYAMADILNNLVTDSSTYWGADGCPVAYASHPQTRRATGTWSNIGTAAALTTTTMFTAYTAMRKRTDEWGYKDPIRLSLLVVPPELEKKAAEIKGSTLVPETSINAKNVMPELADWGYTVYDYATDTNAWWLWGNKGNEEDYNGFIYVQRVAPSVGPVEGKDKATDIIWGQRLRMRVGFGTRIVKNMEYNEGA